MSLCVFLGPTLSQTEAEAILPARYLPPVRRGAVAAALREYQPSRIAIIDGVFEQAPSVWHKEILWALSEGVDIWGASSMGALRAAELEQFGMRGYGRIFEAYRSGLFAPFDAPFEDDDEVAVAHGPSGGEAFSTVAMVDVRATLVAALEEGVIGRAACLSIASAVKAIFFKDRSWRSVLSAVAETDVPAAECHALCEWLPNGAVSLKREDALGLLRHLATDPPPPPPPCFHFERTLLWEIAALGREA
ncbi:MAG: TfuA-like protein [Pseudomonadota bacterium]